MRDAPARRYAYYLTPDGFAEKSRLTLEYLSVSLTLYRRAKKDYTALLLSASKRGISRIAILGASDFAEIAAQRLDDALTGRDPEGDETA